MMIEKYLKTKVCDLFPILTGKVYPAVSPEKTAPPYAVYVCIGSDSENTLTGDSTLYNETIQLDIYTSTYKEAKEYFDTLRAALMDYHGDLSGYPVQRVKIVNGMDGYEPEVVEQKSTLEFQIYY